MTQHEELGWDAVELLADFVADALECLAAGAVRLQGLVVTLDAQQVRGQGLANGLTLGFGADAAGLSACLAAISSSRVSARMASNSTACVVVSRLSLDEPKRQCFRRATSKFSAALRVFSKCNSACIRWNNSRDTRTDSPASAGVASAGDASGVVGSVSSNIAAIVPRARARGNADIHPWTKAPMPTSNPAHQFTVIR